MRAAVLQTDEILLDCGYNILYRGQTNYSLSRWQLFAADPSG